jgi:hypothetical protein
MRKIVDGVAYDTSTSTRLAQWGPYEDVDSHGRNYESSGTLYQTHGGAFFSDDETITQIPERDSRYGGRDAYVREEHEFVPLTLDEAKAWSTNVNAQVRVLSDKFAHDVPEAEGESGGEGATVYVRVPADLKRRIDEAASAAGQSAGSWGLKCFERCLHLDALRKTSEELISMAQRE